jgi:hypothetical protein
MALAVWQDIRGAEQQQRVQRLLRSQAAQPPTHLLMSGPAAVLLLLRITAGRTLFV